LSQSHPPRRGRRGGSGRRPPGAAPKQSSSIAPLHPTLEPPDIQSFREWELGDPIQGAIADMAITVPTPIQRLAIQPVLEGRDVIAKAETGTGKTLAFGAPMMSKIDPARASVLGLVLCPTRELAQQVGKVLEELGKARGVKVVLIVGGDPMGPQVEALKAGAQVVVGTPGRVLDLYKQRFLSFPWTEFAILDEADVMLEIGFIDDVKMILSFTPDERQTLLFSATFPPELLKLAREYTKNPVEIATAAGVSTVDTIEQSWIPIDDEDRALTLIRLIEQSDEDDVFLVFCDRRTEVDKLMRRLERLPFSIKALHGGYDQAARFRVMSAFRTGEVKVLVATDVASRGLDVAHVTTVLNYSSPQDVTDYTHRIGRTGRAGRKGRAITLVGGMDMRRWRPIQREATWDIPQAEPPRASRGPVWRDDRQRDEPRRDEPRRDDQRRDDHQRVDRPRGGRTGAPRPSRAAASERVPAPRELARAEPSRSEPSRSEPSHSEPSRSEPSRSEPSRRDHWPVDQHAHDESVRHPDVRPNRQSPRPARNEGRHTPRSPAASPDERRPTGREPARPASARPHAQPPPAERAAADRDAAERPPAPRRSEVRRSEAREPAARPPARPHAARPQRGTHREDARPSAGASGRPEAAPRSAPDAADRPQRGRHAAPSGRRDRPNPAAQPEERPPGTFERPLTGGLLGNAVRRPTPPPQADEQQRRRRRHR
jgi:ATP-dependent RNA helicase DeaD